MSISTVKRLEEVTAPALQRWAAEHGLGMYAQYETSFALRACLTCRRGGSVDRYYVHLRKQVAGAADAASYQLAQAFYVLTRPVDVAVDEEALRHCRLRVACPVGQNTGTHYLTVPRDLLSALLDALDTLRGARQA